MKANILGWGKNGYSRSILADRYRKYQIEIGSEHDRGFPTDEKYIVNADEKYKYIDTQIMNENTVKYGDGGYGNYGMHYRISHVKDSDFDGVSLRFHAEITANGRYGVELLFSWEELEMLALAKTKSKYYDLNERLENEKRELENKIDDLEDQVDILQKKVEKLDKLEDLINK